MGPKERRSTVLSSKEEALIVAFLKHTLLPLDDCLYALQASIPHLTRSSLHRLFQRHDISRLPSAEGDKPKKRFKEVGPGESLHGGRDVFNDVVVPVGMRWFLNVAQRALPAGGA